MSKVILIPTTNNRGQWVAECLDSLSGSKYPIMVLTEHDYELGKLKWAMEHTDFDEFFLLHDSVRVKNLELLDLVFDHPNSVSLSKKPFFMYLGKYKRDTLNNVGIPVVADKKEAVRYENEWTKKYAEADPATRYMFDFIDTKEFSAHNGRENMIIENKYLVKYKGTWNPRMIKDTD